MRYVALLFGLFMAMMACSAPAFAVPQPNFTTVYSVVKKAETVAAVSATTNAETATASASAVRLCSGYRHTNKIDSANKLTRTNRSPASLIALGVDPGDGSEEGEGDGKLAA